MKTSLLFLSVAVGLVLMLSAYPQQHKAADETEVEYLPDANGSKIVTITKDGTPAAEVMVLPQTLAVKETGPKQTVARFGEVYSFSPAFFAVHRDEATSIHPGA